MRSSRRLAHVHPNLCGFEKEAAAPNYKHGFGFHPLMAYLDATGEALVGLLRPGNAGSGTATDMVSVLDAALAQLPVDPEEHEVIVRSDSAGLSHEFTDAAWARGVWFCIGHRLMADLAAVVTDLPESAWVPSLSSDGTTEREHAHAAEITERLDLSAWPEGTRAIARRDLAHPGAQLSFTDIDGDRFQVFFTDMVDDVAYVEATYRGRGRAECSIRDSKDTGLANLPSADFGINAAWLELVCMAGDLLAGMRALCLDGELAKATPARLRYTLLHTAGIVVHSARRSPCGSRRAGHGPMSSCEPSPACRAGPQSPEGGSRSTAGGMTLVHRTLRHAQSPKHRPPGALRGLRQRDRCCGRPSPSVAALCRPISVVTDCLPWWEKLVLRGTVTTNQEGTSEMKANPTRPLLSVTIGGVGVVNHAGTRLVAEMADVLGLSSGLSAAMAPTRKRRGGHDRGRVLVDLAVAIADGATTISDLAVLRNQPALFGEVASLATAWRTLEAVDEAALARIATARAQARAAAWAAGVDPGHYVIDIDATLVSAHSKKEGAGPTYKGGFGFSPIMAYLDATGEALAGRLRSGNASPGNAADLVGVLDDALYQLPLDPQVVPITVRSDSAGCSHAVFPKGQRASRSTARYRLRTLRTERMPGRSLETPCL